MVAEKSIKSFEDLECWKIGRELRLYLNDLVLKFPTNEKYGLIDQVKRAARSITNNIAEGYGRYHFKENAQFCRISRGSGYEVHDQLIEAHDMKYIDDNEMEKFNILKAKFLKVLNGYINYLNSANNH